MYGCALLAWSCPTSKSFAPLQEVQESGTENLIHWRPTAQEFFWEVLYK